MRLRIGIGHMIVVVVWLMLAGNASAQVKEESKPKVETETVYTTYRVIAGKETEFAKVLAKAWPTYFKLGMVLKQPHIVLRGTDDAGKTYFIEILTWKDHEAPDHAPAEVQAIWDQLMALCEKRDGHRRIEFYEVQIISQKK